MTSMQQRVQEERNKKNGNFPRYDYKTMQVDLGNDTPLYFRVLPNADDLFYSTYFRYKLSEKDYVSYPSRDNLVQKTLNALYNEAGDVGKTIYSAKKASQRHTMCVVLVDDDGKPIEDHPRIFEMSKTLNDLIVESFFENDFFEDGSIFFKVVRTGMAKDTKFSLTAMKGKAYNYDNMPTLPLDISLFFAFSDKKALPHMTQLKKQFNLSVELTNAPAIQSVKKADDETLDDFELQLLKEIEGE